MRKRIAQPNSPDSLYRKGTSGEYYLQIKSATELPGKYEYVLVDADLHEYKVTATDLYPAGKILRCMVRFKIKRGSLLLEKIGICKEQKPRSEKERDNRQKVKKCIINSNVNKNAKADLATIVEDVKKLIEAIENGQTKEQLKSEITRLHRVIVDGQLKDAVIEGCGAENVKMLFGLARSIRRKEKKKQDKQWLSGKGDSDYKKLDNTLRNKWLGWFIGQYGLNGKSNMNKKLYNAILKAAYYLNFVELQKESNTEAQFFLNGMAYCYKIAVNMNLYKSSSSQTKKPTSRKRNRAQNSYITTGSPHVTKKDWGSLYKPGRG